MLVENRDFFDRRSAKDRRRRKVYLLARWRHREPERRNTQDRRSQAEHRADWVRVSKWSSAHLKHLKISKYLT